MAACACYHGDGGGDTVSIWTGHHYFSTADTAGFGHDVDRVSLCLGCEAVCEKISAGARRHHRRAPGYGCARTSELATPNLPNSTISILPAGIHLVRDYRIGHSPSLDRGGGSKRAGHRHSAELGLPAAYQRDHDYQRRRLHYRSPVRQSVGLSGRTYDRHRDEPKRRPKGQTLRRGDRHRFSLDGFWALLANGHGDEPSPSRFLNQSAGRPRALGRAGQLLRLRVRR